MRIIVLDIVVGILVWASRRRSLVLSMVVQLVLALALALLAFLLALRLATPLAPLLRLGTAAFGLLLLARPAASGEASFAVWS